MNIHMTMTEERIGYILSRAYAGKPAIITDDELKEVREYISFQRYHAEEHDELDGWDSAEMDLDESYPGR